MKANLARGIPYPIYINTQDWQDDGNDSGPLIYK